ncbi:hypothetical protein POM88_003240 [Heracleum sosnowskyi]|uniref:Uncharacterized protein n=1 Tax=Heracleum sosnowskyi TaxID=360622 RepID=A0AAD8N6P1_9APIA|nr:hypothetical protein POM88_003240 [Heracleum sosnowskyi]
MVSPIFFFSQPFVLFCDHFSEPVIRFMRFKNKDKRFSNAPALEKQAAKRLKLEGELRHDSAITALCMITSNGMEEFGRCSADSTSPKGEGTILGSEITFQQKELEGTEPEDSGECQPMATTTFKML